MEEEKIDDSRKRIYFGTYFIKKLKKELPEDGYYNSFKLIYNNDKISCNCNNYKKGIFLCKHILVFQKSKKLSFEDINN